MSIDTIVVNLEKTGLPSGPVQVGVFNNDTSVTRLFGTIDASTLTSSFKTYSFSLTPRQNYTIHAGDRIGIKFTGGDSSNNVFIMADSTTSFDRTYSYLSYYDTAWETNKNYELYMILSLHLYGTVPSHKILIFAQWPSPNDTATVQSLMHQHLKPAICFYCITSGDWIEDSGLFPQFPGVVRSYPVASLPKVQEAIDHFSSFGQTINTITYDPEHWDLTPPEEQANVTAATINASKMVHAAGFKFGWVGDGIFLIANYKKINWKDVDMVQMQGPYSERLSSFQSNLPPLLYKIRSDNPNIIIIMQLSLKWVKDSTLFPDPVDQFNAEVDTALADGVDGIGVTYLDPTVANYPGFTLPNLQRVISHLSSVGVGG
jgi:hypothetical protein